MTPIKLGPLVNVPKPTEMVRGPEYHKLLADPDWVAEPKYDGDRCLVHHYGDKTRYWSRDYATQHDVGVTIRDLIHGSIPPLSILDGEFVAGQLVIFDAPCWEGRYWRRSLDERRNFLAGCLPELGPVRLIQQMRGNGEDPFLVAIKSPHVEGIVLKDRRAVYPLKVKTETWKKVRA